MSERDPAQWGQNISDEEAARRVEENTIDTGMGDREPIDEVYDAEGAEIYRNFAAADKAFKEHPLRDGSIHAPDDEFFRERLRVETRVTGPLERADHILGGYGGSFSNPLKGMEDARTLIGEAYSEFQKIMDLCETMSRGIIREHGKRKLAEQKLWKIKGTLDA